VTDDDLALMTREQLIVEVAKLRAAVRQHRDSSGHDPCWHHPDLWGTLPEQVDRDVAVPPWPQLMRGCVAYRQSLDRELPDAPTSVAEFEDTGRSRSPRWIMGGVADWPAWATERVEVRPADPEWQRLGEGLRRELDVALAQWLCAPVEHVGSTAVPGLAAKPILDLQAAVADLGCAPAVAKALGRGWHLVPPDLDAKSWRRFLAQVVDDVRVAHLHLLIPDSERWAEQLAFRDALRGDPGLMQRYAALKQELAAEHAEDREAYTAAKTDFVTAVLGRRPT